MLIIKRVKCLLILPNLGPVFVTVNYGSSHEIEDLGTRKNRSQSETFKTFTTPYSTMSLFRLDKQRVQT